MAVAKYVTVRCVVTRQPHTMPTAELEHDVLQGLMLGEIGYLSEEARNAGWGWMSELPIPWLVQYRTVISYSDDTLMRHLKFFKNPKDATDMSMTDGWEVGRGRS